MATTPPIPNENKLSEAIVVADGIPKRLRQLVDAIKSPDGKAVEHYKELHSFALALKDQVNGLYAMASAADKSLQTGKRKEKNAEKDDKPEKEPTRAERKASRRARRDEGEPEMASTGSDAPY